MRTIAKIWENRYALAQGFAKRSLNVPHRTHPAYLDIFAMGCEFGWPLVAVAVAIGRFGVLVCFLLYFIF